MSDERSSSKPSDLKILHVDDNPDHLEITRMHLEDIVPSIEVTGGTTPTAALELLEEQSFDCVVSDFMMAGMNGIELARKIRETSDFPIIIYTGQGSEEVAEAAFAAGIDDYMMKEQGSAHFAVFAKRIKSHVERHRSSVRSQRFYERIETLHVNAARLALEQNIEGVAETTYESMRNVIGFEICGFTIVEEGLLKLIQPVSESGEPIVMPLSGKGISNRSVKTGESQLVDDVLEDEDYVSWGRGGSIRSGIDVPVKTEGRVVAVLSAANSRIRAFSEEDQKLMETLARHVSSALFRIQQREALRESEERFKLFAEASFDAVVSVDDGHRVTYISPSVERILGFTPGEVLGKTLDDFIEPSEVSKAVRALDRALNGDSGPGMQFINVRKDGSMVPLEYRFTPIQRDGEIIGNLGVLRDVSEKRKREEALERRVDERTREVVEAERMADLGRVAVMVGHDLRGPLVTIVNAAQMTKSNPERSERMLQMIENNAHRGIEMLEGFRERLRSTPINPEMTDLGVLIRTALEDTMIPDNVKSVLRIDEDLGIMIDAPQIRSVLDNLIRNALEAMPEGGELILAADADSENVRLEVSDTGVGVHEEDIPRLYDPFYSSKPDGLGIGLVFCKQTVDAHGGSIAVESEVGKGTTFIVTLPLNR